MATPSVYQRVGNAAVTPSDYDSSVGKFYLRFDGVDDWLVTPTITPGTDTVQVFAGVRKLSDAVNGAISEFSSGLNNGTFGVWTGVPIAANSQYHFNSKGTIIASAITSIGYTSPITNVLTGLGDVSGDSAILRINGIQAASSTADQGAGNYLAYPLYIGRRAGTSFPFNGHIYGLIVRFGANLPADTIASTETWLNGKTGAY